MAITSDSALKAAMAGGKLVRQFVRRNSVSNQLAGFPTSLWRVTGGSPTQGNIPTTAAVITGAIAAGASPLPTAPGGSSIYLASADWMSSVIAATYTYDRIGHMGGLDGTLTSAQTVNLDVSSVIGTRFAAYHELEWFCEWYGDTGSTAVTATLAVTYDDNSTGTIPISIPASMRTYRLWNITPGATGRYIKSIQSCTLSASTGTAGNIGITAAKRLGNAMSNMVANLGKGFDWAELGLPNVHNDACIWHVQISTATVTGEIYGSLLFVQG